MEACKIDAGRGLWASFFLLLSSFQNCAKVSFEKSELEMRGSNGIDRDHYHRFTGPMVQWMHRRLRGHFYKTNIIKCRGENFFVVFVADNIQFVMPVGEVKSIVQRSVLIMGA